MHSYHFLHESDILSLCHWGALSGLYWQFLWNFNLVKTGWWYSELWASNLVFEVQERILLKLRPHEGILAVTDNPFVNIVTFRVPKQLIGSVTHIVALMFIVKRQFKDYPEIWVFAFSMKEVHWVMKTAVLFALWKMLHLLHLLYLTFSVNCHYLLLKRTTSGLVPSFLAKVPFSKGTAINEELCYVVMLQYVRLIICHALINAGLFQILWLLNYCIFLKEEKCTKQFVCFQFISLKRKKKVLLSWGVGCKWIFSLFVFLKLHFFLHSFMFRYMFQVRLSPHHPSQPGNYSSTFPFQWKMGMAQNSEI